MRFLDSRLSKKLILKIKHINQSNRNHNHIHSHSGV
jgi:hypothetical protein